MRATSTPPGHGHDVDLRALFVHCTLEPSPQESHTQVLMEVSQAIMAEQGVRVDHVRAEDLVLAPGVYPDLTEHGAERDDWPQLYTPRCARPTSSRSEAPSGSASAPPPAHA